MEHKQVQAYKTYRKAAAFLAQEELRQAFRLEQIIMSKFQQMEALRLLAGKAAAAQTTGAARVTASAQATGAAQARGTVQATASVQAIVSPQVVETSFPGEHSPLEKAVRGLAILEEDIAGNIAGLLELKRRITRLIESVNHPEYRLLLESRYQNFLSWETIAERMNYSTRQIHRLHDKAIAALVEDLENAPAKSYQTRSRGLAQRLET